MARPPRFAVGGHPHLVMQHARDGGALFVDDLDRVAYLDALRAAASACWVSVHAYVLLDDRVALLVTPREAQALGRFMQRVSRLYVPAYYHRHGGAGAFWRSRFQAAVVEMEHALLCSIRFIEQAPVRAGCVERADEWRWSSAAQHLGKPAVYAVSEHPAYWKLGNTPFERHARHDAELRLLLSKDEIVDFERSVRGGWPIGSMPFIAALEQLTGRAVTPRARGRPRELLADESVPN